MAASALFQAKKGARVQKNYIRKIESRFVGIRKSTGRGSSFSGTNEKGRQAQERTETAMDNTQHTYFAELKLALQKAGYTVQAVEDGHLPIEWNDRRLCQVTESGGIRFRTDDTTDPAAEAARSRVTDIAGVVREYMTLIEQAPDLKANGLGENYKLLAEFNGAVLAGHPGRYGVEFVTWEWSYGRTGLWQGHYYAPGSGPNGYLSAKQDFCVRSGLMNQHRLFTNEQLAEVYRCVRETLECVYPITPERLRLLEGVAEQIRSAVPDLAELVSQSNERELETMAEEEQPDVTMQM